MFSATFSYTSCLEWLRIPAHSPSKVIKAHLPSLTARSVGPGNSIRQARRPLFLGFCLEGSLLPAARQ